MAVRITNILDVKCLKRKANRVQRRLYLVRLRGEEVGNVMPMKSSGVFARNGFEGHIGSILRN